MILADSFECTVPTAVAVKDAVIHCTGNSPDATAAAWAAGAAAVTALLTLALAVFAWRAGTYAKRTVEQMQADARAQGDQIAEAHKLDLAASQKQMEVAAMADLYTSLHFAAERFFLIDPATIDEMTEKASEAAGRWQVLATPTSRPLAIAVDGFVTVLRFSAAKAYADAEHRYTVRNMHGADTLRTTVAREIMTVTNVVKAVGGVGTPTDDQLANVADAEKRLRDGIQAFRTANRLD